jgi:hypothetical protein
VTNEVPVGRDIKNFGHPCGIKDGFAHYRRGVGIRTSRNSPLFAFDLTAWNELRGRAGTENCRALTPPAPQDGCDRRREAAAHADGPAARRAPALVVRKAPANPITTDGRWRADVTRLLRRAPGASDKPQTDGFGPLLTLGYVDGDCAALPPGP